MFNFSKLQFLKFVKNANFLSYSCGQSYNVHFFILATYGLQNVNLNMKYTETMFKKIGEKIINLDFC